MDKFERLEELKRKVMVRLSYEEEIPKEIKKVIVNAFEGILNKYEQLQCRSSSIEQYTESNLKYAENDIYRYLNDERKSNQIGYFQTFFTRLQMELEDESIKQDQTKHKEEINNMEPDDQRTTMKIMDTLEFTLRDIMASQNRILDSRDYNADKINEIQQEANKYINSCINSRDSEIYELLKKDNNELKSWILEQYEEYLQQEKSNSEKDESQKSAREEFTESLDANIDLKEQNDFATKIVEKSKEEQENKDIKRLPDNVIE